ncbi:hypothetical protein [Gemmatimonas sp.]|uniref:DUF3108 domain-containing protein n=1 Tax=Gemmatimonas sp. TaxID=1962908 RepID=UPI003982EEBD
MSRPLALLLARSPARFITRHGTTFPTIRCGLSAAALMLVPVSAPLGAQQVPPVPAPTVQAVLIAPGDSTLRGGRILADSVQYSLIAYRGEQQQMLGTAVDVVKLEMRSDGPVIHRVLTVSPGRAPLIDSTVTDARTLAPRRHRNVSSSRLISLDFNGRRVKGSIGPVDVPSLPIDTTLAIAPFDSGNWDLVVRSLPLEKGYAARFRVYDTDSGLREYRIEVTGSATVLDEDAHVVIFTLAPKRESVVWIGKKSRRLLQVETLIDANTLLRQLRQVR